MSGNIKVVLFLAAKSLIKGNRWALALIIMVMAFSYANLIFIDALLNGVTRTIDTQLINTSLANIIIEPPVDRYYLEHVDNIAKKIWQVPGVTGVGIHLNSGALFQYGWEDKRSPGEKAPSGNWSVIGIDPEAEKRVTSISEHVFAGSYLDEGDRDFILLGVEIAGGPRAATAPHLTLGGVSVGEKVRLTYGNGITREYRVKGIFQVKEITSADRLAYVTRREMAGILGNSTFAERASQVIIKTATTGNEAAAIRELEALGINGQLRSWQNYGAAVRGIVNSFDFVASIIGSAGIGVSGIVMFIILYITAVTKKRQIGILRAIGIKDRLIVWSYLLQALFCAAWGIIIGSCVMLFGVEPYFRNHPLDLALGPVSLALSAVTTRDAIIGLLLAAFLAGIIPVVSINRESIIKAIWGS